MIENSLICKLINVQASMKENNEKKIKNEDEISKLIKAFPKDIAALVNRSVLAKEIKERRKGKRMNLKQTSGSQKYDWLISYGQERRKVN